MPVYGHNKDTQSKDTSAEECNPQTTVKHNINYPGCSGCSVNLLYVVVVVQKWLQGNWLIIGTTVKGGRGGAVQLWYHAHSTPEGSDTNCTVMQCCAVCRPFSVTQGGSICLDLTSIQNVKRPSPQTLCYPSLSAETRQCCWQTCRFAVFSQK